MNAIRYMMRGGLVLVLTGLVTGVQATSLTWDTVPGDGGTVTGGAGSWTDGAANWNDGSGDVNWSNANPDSAIFGGTAGTATLGGAITVGTITFNTAGYLVTGGSMTLSGATVTANANAEIATALGGTGGLTKQGVGTLTLSGTNSYTGETSVWGGALTLTGTNAAAGMVKIQNGVLGVASSGVLNAWQIALCDGGVNATMNIGDSAVVSGNNWIFVSSAANAAQVAVVNMTGGTLNAGLSGGGNSWESLLIVGVNAGQGTINQSGGTVNVGVRGVCLGWYGAATIGTYNLNGGTLSTPDVHIGSPWGAGQGYFTFNGGTLKATTDTTTFMYNLTSAKVNAGGAVIDSNSKNITISQALLHDAALGGTVDGGLTKKGLGILSLSGANTYTGETRVDAGTIRLANPLSQPFTTVRIAAGAVLNLDFTGITAVKALYTNGVAVANGSHSSTDLAPFLTGIGTLLVGDETLTWTGTAGAGWNTTDLNWVSGASVTSAWKDASHAVLAAENSGTLTLGATPVLAASVAVSNSGYTVVGGTLSTPRITAAADVTVGCVLNQALVKSGPAVLSLTATNTYTGNTTIEGGTLRILGAGSLYTAGLNNTAVLTVGNGGVLELDRWGYGTGADNMALGGLDYNPARLVVNGGTIRCTGGAAATPSSPIESPYGPGFTVGASGATLDAAKTNDTWTVKYDSRGGGPVASQGGTLTLAGAGNGVFDKDLGGTGGITKTGEGVWTLSRNVTAGSTAAVRQGILNVTGILNAGVDLVVGDQAGKATFATSGTVTRNRMLFGNAAGAVGAGYQTAGSVVTTLNGGGSTSLGNTYGGYGFYRILAGGLQTQEIAIGTWGLTYGNNNGGSGMMEIAGGSVTNLGWIVMNRSEGGLAVAQNSTLSICGTGSLTYAGGGLNANWGGSGSNQYAVINVSDSGSLSTVNSTPVNLSWNGNAANTGILNLNGGTLMPSVVTGARGFINFNGGTLKAYSDQVNFVTVGDAYVWAGGATIDSNGRAITIGQTLRAPSGSGVTAVVVTDGGSGYICPPIVKITGGMGVPATAQAVMAADTTGKGTFKIDGIVLTSPGVYTVDPTGVELVGGGAAVPATFGTISTAANTVSGGLTKTGAGTLTLTASNTYTGTTTVSNGTLKVTAANVLSNVVVAAAGLLDMAGTAQTLTSLQCAGSLTNNTAVSIASGAFAPAGNGTIGMCSLDTPAALSGFLSVDVLADGSSDRLAVNGALNATLAVSVVNPGDLDGSKVYVLATCMGKPTGTYTLVNVPAPWQIRREDGQLVLGMVRGMMISVF